jgi:hypothetical protein
MAAGVQAGRPPHLNISDDAQKIIPGSLKYLDLACDWPYDRTELQFEKHFENNGMTGHFPNSGLRKAVSWLLPTPHEATDAKLIGFPSPQGVKQALGAMAQGQAQNP